MTIPPFLIVDGMQCGHSYVSYTFPSMKINVFRHLKHDIIREVAEALVAFRKTQR